MCWGPCWTCSKKKTSRKLLGLIQMGKYSAANPSINGAHFCTILVCISSSSVRVNGSVGERKPSSDYGGKDSTKLSMSLSFSSSDVVASSYLAGENLGFLFFCFWTACVCARTHHSCGSGLPALRAPAPDRRSLCAGRACSSSTLGFTTWRAVRWLTQVPRG